MFIGGIENTNIMKTKKVSTLVTGPGSFVMVIQ
jgi:hypothetical protein